MVIVKKFFIKNMKKINILYIIWSLGLGGAERVVINLAKGLDKTRFNPIICCLNWPGEFAHELEDIGIQVIPMHKKGKLDFLLIFRLVNLMRQHKIDIVHTHLFGSNLWGRIAAIKAKVPIIITTEHNVDVQKTGFQLLLDRWLSQSTKKIIAVSNSVKEFYVSKGISSDKIEVVYNGIEITMSPCHHVTTLPVKDELGVQDGETVLAVVGRLVPQKGHRYLFEALSLLNGKHRFKLLVVGDGLLAQSLKVTTLQSHQLKDKVIFTGMRKDVRDILGITDILILPSLREGLPIVVLEAMSCGVPVVATDVGGTHEVVENEVTGILVEPENPLALAEATRRLLHNRNLAKQMGKSGYERVVQTFSLEKMVDKHERLYEECLKK